MGARDAKLPSKLLKRWQLDVSIGHVARDIDDQQVRAASTSEISSVIIVAPDSHFVISVV